MSTFSGINASVTALRAHRSAMDVIGQNVANVNTPGYTRQRADLEMLNAPGGSGMLTGNPVTGGGVRIVGISRAFDAVQSARVNVQTGDHALQQERAATLSDLEALTQEPSDAGLATQLNKMWAAYADAATKVGSTNADGAARQSVLGAARNVVATLNAAWNTVDQQWSTTRTQVGADVDEVNSMASSVAVLNEQIQKATTTGGAPNELMDKRDQLVTRIVELTGATTQAGRNGQVDLYLGGGLLVQGNLANELTVSENPNTMSDVVNGQLAAEALAGPSASSLTSAQVTAYQALVAKGTITVKVGENTATPLSGKLAGQVEALSKTLPKASRDYDAVATSLAAKVNALQKTVGGIDGNGKTVVADATALTATTVHGTDLFTSNTPSPFTDRITAGSIALGESVTGNALVLGMAANGAKDGSVAVKIAAISTSKADPTSSVAADRMDPPDRMWASYVSDLGARSSSEEARTSAAQAVLTSSIADQQGAAGVSLDEESADLIAAQRAYQGAARVLTAVDEMLDTLINKTGLVGR